MLDSPGGEQLLQSHLSVHSAWNAWERGWSERLTWVQDMEISVQDRPASLQPRPGRTTAYPMEFAFSFPGFFFCWFSSFWSFISQSVRFCWPDRPCQHCRPGACLPRWIGSKAWSGRSLHKQGLDPCVCTDSAPSPNGLALVSCFLSVRKRFLLFPDALSVFSLIWIDPVVLPLQPWWLGPCIPLIWDWPCASASPLSHHTTPVAYPTAV